MNWIEDLEAREMSIRKRLELDRRASIFEPVNLDAFRGDIEVYSSALDSHCSEMDEGEETAFRYAIRLKLPLLHHLRVLKEA
jgi:hypothetical protein